MLRRALAPFLLPLLVLAPGIAHTQAGNLVPNPDFAANTADWIPFNANGSFDWDSEDADGSVSSGSALLTVTTGSGMSTACIPVSEGQALDASVAFRISGADPGGGSLSVSFFGAAGCSSFISSESLPGNVTTVDAWTVHTGETTTVAGTVAVRLGVSLIPDGTSAVANIDNAFLGLEAQVGLKSEHYQLIGGSLVSGAQVDMAGAGISLSGVSLGEPSAGPTMTAPNGMTLEPGFWPIVAAPEPGAAGCAAAALLALTGLRRKERWRCGERERALWS